MKTKYKVVEKIVIENATEVADQGIKMSAEFLRKSLAGNTDDVPQYYSNETIKELKKLQEEISNWGF